MRLHAMQTAPVWLDAAENRRRISAAFASLDASPGDFVVLPEMCETGWTADPTAVRAITDSTAWIASLASSRQVWVQAGFGEHLGDGRIANSAAIAAPDGAIRAIYRKNFLFPNERNAYAQGSDLVVIDTGFAKVCPLICYDLRFPELWRLASRAGAEIFSVSSAWPSVRHEHWRTLLAARAIENQAVVVASNRCGTDPSLVYSGGSVVIDALGTRIAEADAEERTVSAPFSRDVLDDWRTRFGALRDRRDSLLGEVAVRRV